MMTWIVSIDTGKNPIVFVLEFNTKLRVAQRSPKEMKMNINKTKDTLNKMIEDRSLRRKEFFKSYKKPVGRTTTTTSFKPLPSDLIQDPTFWPEWKLNKNLEVVKT